MVAEIWASVMSSFVDQLVALTPSRLGATDPSNNDNLNGDGGVCVCMRARVCV